MELRAGAKGWSYGSGVIVRDGVRGLCSTPKEWS